jgi:hypothetical protein
VIVTPTASGETLCYKPAGAASGPADKAKALYMFPTKALAQDQVILAILFKLMSNSCSDLEGEYYLSPL